MNSEAETTIPEPNQAKEVKVTLGKPTKNWIVTPSVKKKKKIDYSARIDELEKSVNSLIINGRNKDKTSYVPAHKS